MAAEVLPAVHDEHVAPQHDFHILEPSPWPIVGAMSALLVTGGLVLWMHEYPIGKWIWPLGILGILTTMFFWWRDVLRESAHGDHKAVVSRGLRIGMGLFIVSEVFFFVAFFWAFFWSALYPPMTVATSWPPAGIQPLVAWQIPFMNTLILLLSGATVTWAHHCIREGDQATGYKALLLTVILGASFTGFQIYEYAQAIHEGLTLKSEAYGSTFFMATGFHGFHVFVGSVFLFVCMMRAYYGVFRPEKHVGFEAATWYWHFVDVVWLFLFVWVYWWGGSLAFTTAPVAGS